MDYGLHMGTRGVAGTPDGLQAMARHCEEHGFSYLGFSDHVIIAKGVDSKYPYNEQGVWPAADTGFCLEQLMTIAHVAAVTRKIRLLTSVMVIPHRPAVLTAKMLATADVLSNGRLTVGLGVGWMAEEMAVLQSPPYAERAKASHEYIEAFRELWTAAAPAYQGAYVVFDNLFFEPKPVQTPHPPIWTGGEGGAARRRAGTYADGWYPAISNPKVPLDTPERYAAVLNQVRAETEAAGRDPAALDAALFATWYNPDTEIAGSDGTRRPFTGAPAQIAHDIAAYRTVGLNHLIIGFESNELALSQDRTAQFAEAIWPQAH